MLASGEIVIEGRMPWSSNATMLVTVHCGEESMPAVYKPEQGERPLWDYPHGLWRREVATYVVSDELRWHLVPETVTRLNGPMGRGSLQRFVEDASFEDHYFTLIEDPATHDRLRQMCVFDLVVNNADRKAGHCLLGDDDVIWLIDHGVCFSDEPKLRTVIWEFVGEPFPDDAVTDLRRVRDDLADEGPTARELRTLLAAPEVEATVVRIDELLASGVYPPPGPGRPFPWPPI